MSYIESRNQFILKINNPEFKKPKEFFTPDDIARFIGKHIYEKIQKDGLKNVTINDPIGGSGNLIYQIVTNVGIEFFDSINLNLYNDIKKIDITKEYDNLKESIESEINNINILNFDFSKRGKNDINTTFVVGNLYNNLLGKHDEFQKNIGNINKYCFILDTNSPKAIKRDSKNFSIEKVIDLGDGVGIGGKHYYLYIYSKKDNGEKDFLNVFYEFNAGYQNYNNNIFIGKKKELILGHKTFDELIEKTDLYEKEEVISIELTLKDIFETQNKVIQNYNDLLKNFFQERNFLESYKTPYLMKKEKVIDIISQIQLSGQKIKSEKLYEILIALSASSFLILSGASGVGKTSLVDKISQAIGGKFLKFPIKSNLSDETGIIGYWNPLLSQYESTEVLKFLFDSNSHSDIPYFLLLDEMNLSRIENYLSEFLIKIDDLKENSSIKIKLFEGFIDNKIKWEKLKMLKNSLKIDINNFIIKNEFGIEIIDDESSNDFSKSDFFNNFTSSKQVELYCKLNPNIHIIGTINEDEATFSLSKKVLDRAFYIELGIEDLFEDNSKIEENKFTIQINKNINYFDITKKQKGNFKILETYKDFLNQLNMEIQKINNMDSIGYRTIEEIARYFENYKEFIEDKGKTEQINKNILSIVLCQKVLPKISNYFLLGNKEKEFNNILNLIETNIGKESESYKKVEKFKDILFNN